MAENEVKKPVSKTEAFKIYLQGKYTEILGKKVSKQQAWDLFKASQKAPFETILANWVDSGKPAVVYGEKIDSLTLPLAGVGTFKVIATGGADKTNVKPRLYPSSAIEHDIQVALGFAPAEVADADVETLESEDVAVAETLEAVADDLDI